MTSNAPLACEEGALAERPRVLIVATHPIQYQVPWFQALAKREEIDLLVLFIQMPDPQQQGVGFGMAFKWDIPLLEGYRWQQASGVRGRGGPAGFFAARLHRPAGMLRNLAPDVVLITGWHAWPLLQLLLAARSRGVPVIIRGESNALRKRPLPVRILHRCLMRLCMAFLTIGKSNREFYRGYGVRESSLFDAAYFVDNARFMAAAALLAPRRDELRAAWNIPVGAVCFCFAGKLQPKKRILDLLAALRIAQEQSTQSMHLLIVGTGEQMPQARAFVDQHRLSATFAGFLNQTEIPSAYVAADCLVLPSDYGETWGLVVNEAMACGRPALVSDRVGCGPDLISDGRTGALFPFGDVEALARNLVEMAADPAQLRAMGILARDLVSGRYSVENAVEGTLKAVRFVRAYR